MTFTDLVLEAIPCSAWPAATGGAAPGLISGAAALLAGYATVLIDPATQAISVTHRNEANGYSAASSIQRGQARVWSVQEGSACGTLLIAEAVLLGLHPVVRLVWRQLVAAIDPEGALLPSHAEAIHAIGSQNEPRALMNRLAWRMHEALDERTGSGQLIQGEAVFEAQGGTDHTAVVLLQKGRSVQDTRPAVTPMLERLARRVRRGGAALLVGPTGTFKTETAKQAALAAGAQLTIIKGRPGIEDRDFYGGVYPGEDGPQWLDGPLTAAFRNARNGLSVLLIDELLRLEPLYRNTLIGALDTLSAAEVTALGGIPTGSGRHYALTLPTGELISAPAGNFALLATTNIGSGYQQLDGLDDALLRRFTSTYEFALPDEAAVRQVYRQRIADPRVVEAAIELEFFTRSRHVGQEGLLARAANPGVILNLLDEYQAEREDPQASPADAFLQAVNATVVPYCAPREANGMLEQSAAVMLQHQAGLISERHLPQHRMLR